jgi:hypothetical protein
MTRKTDEFTSEVEAVLKSLDHMVSRPAGIKKNCLGVVLVPNTCILQQCGHLRP